MEIKTAGELRSFLAEVMVDIRNKKLKPQEATAIIKVAAQINQSLAVEVNTALQLEKLGKGGAVAGSMQIGSSEQESAPSQPSVKQSVAKLEAHFQGKKWCDQCEDQVDNVEVNSCKSRYCSFNTAREATEVDHG